MLVDVQRGGPSTGLPTKTEQSDLLLAMYGRHGESPLPIVAALLAEPLLRRRVRGGAHRAEVPHAGDPPHRRLPRQRAEPWKLPDIDALPDISVPFATEPNHGDEFWPYLRDPETLARPWAIPGTPGLMHRIGGLEKEDGTGNVNYDPDNHELMTRIRGRRRSPDRERHPAASRSTTTTTPSVLRARLGEHVGRAISAAVRRVRARGQQVAHAHLAPPQPVPAPTSARSLARYPKVLVPEMNLGQLSKLVRAEFLVDAPSRSQGAGRARSRRPRSRTEILEMIDA